MDEYKDVDSGIFKTKFDFIEIIDEETHQASRFLKADPDKGIIPNYIEDINEFIEKLQQVSYDLNLYVQANNKEMVFNLVQEFPLSHFYGEERPIEIIAENYIPECLVSIIDVANESIEENSIKFDLPNIDIDGAMNETMIIEQVAFVILFFTQVSDSLCRLFFEAKLVQILFNNINSQSYNSMSKAYLIYALHNIMVASSSTVFQYFWQCHIFSRTIQIIDDGLVDQSKILVKAGCCLINQVVAKAPLRFLEEKIGCGVIDQLFVLVGTVKKKSQVYIFKSIQIMIKKCYKYSVAYICANLNYINSITKALQSSNDEIIGINLISCQWIVQYCPNEFYPEFVGTKIPFDKLTMFLEAEIPITIPLGNLIISVCKRDVNAIQFLLEKGILEKITNIFEHASYKMKNLYAMIICSIGQYCVPSQLECILQNGWVGNLFELLIENTPKNTKSILEFLIMVVTKLARTQNYSLLYENYISVDGPEILQELEENIELAVILFEMLKPPE